MLDARVCCIGLAAITLCGCAVAPDIYRRVQDEVSVAVQMEVTTAEQPLEVCKDDKPVRFEEVLLDVVRENHTYRLANGEVKAADIQWTSARCQPWPRLVAEVLFEAPIGESETYLTGGLYLRMDLLRAFLYRNAVTAAEVGRAANEEMLHASAQEAVHSFLRQTEMLDAALRAQAKSQAAIQLATRASAEADALIRAGRLSFERGAIWEKRRTEKEIESRQIEAGLQKIRMGITRSYSGRIPESDLLEGASNYMDRVKSAISGEAVDPAEILERDPAVIQAKLKLFLAELAVLEARLKRLPGISLDLGSGNIPIEGESRNVDSGLVPMLRITLPLIDMGDISRAVKTAQIRAEQSRERMIGTVEGSHGNWQTIRQEVVLAAAAFESAERLCNATSKRRDTTLTFADSGLVSVMDAHETAWMQIDTEALLDQTRHQFRMALLAEFAVRGELFDNTMQAELEVEANHSSP